MHVSDSSLRIVRISTTTPKAEAKKHRKESRQKKKAEKTTEQASYAAAGRTHPLKQALKTSQKGKKHSLKAPAKATSKKRCIVRPTASEESQGAAASAPAIQSRRGRAINTPTQYL
jgi:hypothetical protein